MDFSKTISAKGNPDETIKKIANVPQWWGITFSGSAQKQGDTFTARMSGDSFFNITVEELIPGKRVVWLVTDCHMPWYKDQKEWTGTRMIFDISGNALTFTHKGITPEKECYKDCEKGWNQFIGTALADYLERPEAKMENVGQRVTLGNHMSVIVPKQDRDAIRKFYQNVLGAALTKADKEKDILKLNDDTFLVFLYGDVPDSGDFQRTARSMWLELKADNVEETKKKIENAGVTILNVPDPHLYFQAPGGQCWRLVQTDEDLSFYEGGGKGPDVKRIKDDAKDGFKTAK